MRRRPGPVRPRRRPGAAAVLATALAFGAAACSSVTRGPLAAGPGGGGSLAAGSGQGAYGGTSSAGAGAAGAGSGSLPGASGAGAPSALSSGTTGASGSAGGAASGAPGPAGAGPGAGSTGSAGTQHRCSQPVRLGISYSSDEAQGFAAVGHPQVATQFANYTQTLKQGYQIGVDDLNRQGGLAGCKVELVYHDFSSLAGDGFDGESQKECTDFAEDQHAFAVLPGALEDRVLLSCLAQAKVPVFWDVTTYNPTKADFARYRGYLYQPSEIAPDRFGPFISDLAKAGYFGSGAKVGILLADNGTGNNQALVNNLWKPALAAMHIPVTVFTYTQIDSFSSVSDAGSQFSSAVLQFKTAGVDHVILTPDGGDGLIFFTAAAESQGYHPRYGLTTDSAPAGMTAAPADQAHGAVAVSWSVNDLLNISNGSAVVSGLGTNPVRSHCDQLYSSFASANSEPVATFYPYCDFLATLQQALAKAPAPTVAALLSGVESLGSSLNPANGYAPSQLGTGRYDGGSAVRMLAWSDAAKNFTLSTPPEAVP